MREINKRMDCPTEKQTFSLRLKKKYKYRRNYLGLMELLQLTAASKFQPIKT